MKVIRAKHAGVCYGVERALDMAVAAMMDEDNTYTLGPLIHNPKVVEELRERGVEVAESVDDLEEGIVVIRSHGVEPQVLSALREKGLTVIDATCPHVAKAQRSAGELRDAGGTVIVIGRSEHPEVKGLCGHAGPRAVVVADASELPDTLEEPVGIVVQTTESKEKLDAVVEAVRARGFEPEVKNTICFATRQRQNSAAALAEEVDAIVVIGGKNSSNPTHLFNICKAHCDEVFLRRIGRRARFLAVRRVRNCRSDRRCVHSRRPDSGGCRISGNLVEPASGVVLLVLLRGSQALHVAPRQCGRIRSEYTMTETSSQLHGWTRRNFLEAAGGCRRNDAVPLASPMRPSPMNSMRRPTTWTASAAEKRAPGRRAGRRA